MRRKGLVQVYTGKGKGKTTASVGLAIRARGHNLKVCVVRFFKAPEAFEYGEDKILKKIGVKIYHCACRHPHFYKNLDPALVRCKCLDALELAKDIFKRQKSGVVILDEINICLRDKFLDKKEVISLLKKKPKNLEVVLTGRGAPKSIIKFADLVSDIKEVKHPYRRGMKERRGIEY